ncbi:MAG: response regulator [Rhodoferax sp.]
MNASHAHAGLLFAVDDDHHVGDFIVRVARRAHYEAHAIDSGLELIRRLAENPDVILLDLTMPEFDGMQTIAALSNASYRGRLIIASGNDPDDVDKACAFAKTRGMRLTGSLRKPFRVSQLLEMLALPEH